MRPAAPCKLFALCIGYWNCLWRLRKAVPDLFEQAEAVSNAERANLCAHGAHGGILRFSFWSRKPHLSTDNARLSGRRQPVRSSLLFGVPSVTRWL